MRTRVFPREVHKRSQASFGIIHSRSRVYKSPHVFYEIYGQSRTGFVALSVKRQAWNSVVEWIAERIQPGTFVELNMDASKRLENIPLFLRGSRAFTAPNCLRTMMFLLISSLAFRDTVRDTRRAIVMCSAERTQFQPCRTIIPSKSKRIASFTAESYRVSLLTRGRFPPIKFACSANRNYYTEEHRELVYSLLG